jgi:hypothetical protein
LATEKEEERKVYQGSENHSLHLLRKRSHFGKEYKSSIIKRGGGINGGQEGCRLGQKLAPDES